MSVNLELVFKEIVEDIFNRWTALKMCVEHGMGGRNGHQTAIEIMNYMTEFCVKNPTVGISDVEECLEDCMDQEFETICEDGSITEISNLLVKYLKMCQEGRLAEIQGELIQKTPVTKWLCPGAKITYAPVEDSSSDDDDEMMDEDGPVVESTSVSIGANSNQGPIVDADGWTTVSSTRRKKK